MIFKSNCSTRKRRFSIQLAVSSIVAQLNYNDDLIRNSNPEAKLPRLHDWNEEFYMEEELTLKLRQYTPSPSLNCTDRSSV